MELRQAVAALAKRVLPTYATRDGMGAMPSATSPSLCFDRRQSARREVESTLTATTRDGSVFRGYSRDMNDTGTAALIWGELNVGDEIRLKYRLPNSTEVVELPAVVRYRVGFRYGMEFATRPHHAEGLSTPKALDQVLDHVIV